MEKYTLISFRWWNLLLVIPMCIGAVRFVMVGTVCNEVESF